MAPGVVTFEVQLLGFKVGDIGGLIFSYRVYIKLNYIFMYTYITFQTQPNVLMPFINTIYRGIIHLNLLVFMSFKHVYFINFFIFSWFLILRYDIYFKMRTIG